jgi:hypothetical protein
MARIKELGGRELWCHACGDTGTNPDTDYPCNHCQTGHRFEDMSWESSGLSLRDFVIAIAYFMGAPLDDIASENGMTVAGIEAVLQRKLFPRGLRRRPRGRPRKDYSVSPSPEP